MKRLRIAIAGAAILAASSIVAAADPVAEFYKDNAIRVIVASDAGGVYDVDARLVLRHFSKYVPGNPRIIPQMMPGASGKVAANHLYNVAAKDGSVLGAVQNVIPLAQLMGEGGIRYNATEFNWIGSPLDPHIVLVVWHETGVKTIADATKQEITLGATTSTGTNFIFPQLLNQFVGTKFKTITGYKAGPAISLAMERGEVQGRGAVPWDVWKLERPEWVASKKILPLMQASLVKHANLDHVPRLVDLASTPEATRIFQIMSVVSSIGRPLLAPPGVPPERVEALRRAFAQTIKDPEFLADAAKLGKSLSPIGGRRVSELVQQLFDTPPEIVDRLKRSIGR